MPAAGQQTALCDTLIKKGIDAMWQKDYVKSLELLTSARNMAEKNRWHKQHFLAINNIGANYYSMLDYGEALNYYLESYTIAVKELEPKYEMVVLNNIAILYSKEKNFEKAREYFLKAYTIARDNKDAVKTGLYAMNLGNVANETKKAAEAKAYFTESIPYLNNAPELLVMAHTGLAENELLQGNPQAARRQAQAIYSTTGNLEYNDVGLSLLFIIAKSYLQEKNYGMAKATLQDILLKEPNLETKKSAFELLCDIYMQNKLPEEALRYKDSIISTDRKLNEVKNGRLFENSRVKFEMQNYKNELALNEEKLAGERKLFFYILSVIVAVVVIVILALRNVWVKNRQKQLIAERNEKEMALELEKEKNDHLLLEKQVQEKESSLMLEQERLKSEIEARNRKLSAKALYLTERDRLIEDILQSLSGIPQLEKDTRLSGHIRTLRAHLKSNDEWDSFITHFEEVNSGLLTKLKTLHPALTANDIRFIAYIYMNLSTKEIASMLNITAEACRKRKERIAAKMELTENVTLYDYISSIRPEG